MYESHPDVVRVAVGEREIILVGTAHVSRESVDLVRQVIEAERPDSVCLELDAQRYDALANPERFAQLDLREVMRRKQLPTLILNLVLVSYQRRLGESLGVPPGEEMLEGSRTAERLGIALALVDRDVRITLRRAWNTVPWYRKFTLLTALITALLEKPEMSEDDLRELRRQDIASMLAQELGKAAPGLKEVLLDERDLYMADRIRHTAGRKLVVLIGAGHLNGLKRALEQGTPVNVPELEVIPPLSPVWSLIGWAIPGSILLSIVWIGWTQGWAAAGSKSMFWILITGGPCAIGAVAALAHPATILTAFLAAPITTLSPVLGAGYVTAFAQLYFKPPLIGELHTVPRDIGTPIRWWQNRLLQIFLVFLFTTLGASIGTFIGGANILSDAF